MAEEVRILSQFKEKICDCVGLVCKMTNEERITAMEFWNEVSERLQTVLDKSVGITLDLQNKVDVNLQAKLIDPLALEEVGVEDRLVTGFVGENEDDHVGGEVLVNGPENGHQKEREEQDLGVEKEVVNYIIVNGDESTHNPKSVEIDGKVESENYIIIEPEQSLQEEEDPEVGDEGQEAEKVECLSEAEGALKEKVLVLQNSELTVNIGQSDSEDFHPDDDFDDIMPENESSKTSYENTKGSQIRKTNVPKVLNSIIEETVKSQLEKQKVKKWQISENGDPEPVYECEICQKPFLTFFAFTAHNWQHTRPFKCFVCNRGFSTKGSLSVHSRKHTGEKPFNCITCSASFTTHGNLKRHVLTHTGVKPWACSVCNARFTEKKSLKIHTRIHTGEKPYDCKLCGQSFSQKGTLTTHMDVHSKKKPHTCDLCGRSFAQKSNLRSHKSRHFSQRDFNCDYCACKFHNKGDLIRHMKGHTGEKALTCNICLKTFSRKNNLTDHLNRHFDVKPWECSACKDTFFTRELVRLHLKDNSTDESHKPRPGQTVDDLINKITVNHTDKEVVNLEVEDVHEELLGDMVIHVDENSGLVVP